MILLNDKQAEAMEARRVEQEQLHEPPPPTYTSIEQASSSSPFKPKPSNFVSITRVHGSVKESIVLDPSLYIPAFLLPALSSGESEATRKNLRLESTHGSIHANIDLLPHNEVEPVLKKRRVTMYMKSTHGNVTAKVHGPASRPYFILKASSTNGDVQIHIPRSFHGPLILSVKHGSVKFSDDLSEHLTTFGEINSTRRCFVGDFSQGIGKGEWKGDEIVVDVRHGVVKMQYDDDVAGSVIKSRPTFLNRIFGF